jgi:hypothetical protein
VKEGIEGVIWGVVDSLPAEGREGVGKLGVIEGVVDSLPAEGRDGVGRLGVMENPPSCSCVVSL